MIAEKEAFFSTENLAVGYNGRMLISEISFSIRRGEILTLIGPNGSGKSTILKSITKHLSTISGVVYIDSKSMKLMSNKETATRLSVVLTDRVKPELMTCGELVATGRYPYTNSFGTLSPDDKAIVRESLERVRALELYDRDFSAISDGQRQRILLARAICQQPEIIVLDEPTSFLDIRHKIELLGILSEMAKEKHITVIMSLHEIDLAYKISDKIMCVKGDKIYSFGEPDEIFRDDTVDKLYDIENGSYDVAFGSVELARPSGAAQAFIIGGSGSGIPYYREMQKLGVAFCAGILFENDIDYRVAKGLAQTAVSQRAFFLIDDALLKTAMDLMETFEYVVDCGCEFGEFNRANEALLTRARELGKRIITSIAEMRAVFGGQNDD